MLRRTKAIYFIMDKRGRQALILVQVNQSLSMLMGTVAMGGLVGFLIILGRPQIVLDNRYMAAVYHGLGFENQSHFLLLISGLLLLFVAVQQVIGVLSGLVQIRLLEVIVRRCTIMVYRYYLTGSYEDQIKRGTAQVIVKALMAVKTTVTKETTTTSRFIAGLLNISVIFSVLYLVHAQATLIFALLALSFYLVFFIGYKKKTRLAGKQIFQRGMRHASLIREGTAGAAEIKLMGKERDFINEANESMAIVARERIRQNVRDSIPQPSVRLVAMISLYIISAYVFLGDSPKGAFATLTLFAAGAFRLLPSLQSVFDIFIRQEFDTYQYEAIMTDLKAAKDHVAEYEKSKGRFELIQAKDCIVFDHVTYAYPETDKPVLNDLSFSLPANKTVALFGGSGVGKTTLIRLLSGLLIPQKGRVMVDGKSLQDDVTFRRNWQQSTGVTFQKPFFLDATLAMNIAFEASLQKVDLEKARRAVKLAQLEDFVASLPRGLDTKVEEDAEILSGGQRQRLAIARALYRESSVLIFDEATNALDLVVEKEIIKALMRVSANKMIFIIAHRPETMRFADVVLVMKGDGSVVQGGYDELFETDADFRALLGAQELLAG